MMHAASVLTNANSEQLDPTRAWSRRCCRAKMLSSSLLMAATETAAAGPLLSAAAPHAVQTRKGAVAMPDLGRARS
jgi:hypothetical protein